MCFTFVLSVVFPDVVTEANGINSENDYYTKIDVDTYRQAATFPEKEGYVFAGWYQDAEFKNAVSGATPGDGAYAKFLDSTVLSVKCQLKKGTTLDSKSTDLRLITSVDSLDYQTVGFDLEVNGKTASITSKTVYQTIYGYVNDASESYTPGDVFSQTDSRYFMTKNVTNIPQSAFETDILATPFWITLDGTKVTGTARTVKIGDKLFTPDSLGFVAGTGTTMTQEMKDGETVVKAVLSGDGTQIYFKDVVAEDGSKGAFFARTYQYVTFDMYVESTAGFLFNTSTHNIWTNGAGYDWSPNVAGSATQGDYLRSYMNEMRKPLSKGAWYTVSMKIDKDNSPTVSISARDGAATVYLKNLTFGTAFPTELSKDTFKPDSLGFMAGSDVTTTREAKDGEAVVKAVVGDGAKVYFNEILSENGIKGKFFTLGYQYVTFDMYVESTAGFLFNTSTHNIWTNGAGYDWSTNGAGSATQGDYLRSYVNGVRSPINKGAWYTVSMKVEDYSTDVSITASGGAATIYLKNLAFADAFPIEIEPGQPDPLGFKLVDASTGSSVVKVTEGDFANTMKFTASGSGDEWSNYNRVTFEGIDCANKTGLFYDHEWSRVEFQVYFTGGHVLIPDCATPCWWSTYGHDAGDANLWNYLTVKDASGNSVKNVTSGQWYTFSFSATNASELSLGFQPGAVAYFRNLKFTN